MFKVKTDKVELRGISHKQGKTGNVYYIVNVELEDGTPIQLFCKDSSAFPQGLHKGDYVEVTINVSEYNNNYNLTVVNIEKVDK